MDLQEAVEKTLADEITALTTEINSFSYNLLPLWATMTLGLYCGLVAVAFSWSGWNPSSAAKAVVPVLLIIAPMAAATTLYLFRKLDRQLRLRQLRNCRDIARKLLWLNTADPKVKAWRYELLSDLFDSHGLKLPALQVETHRPKLSVIKGDKP
jgi:hypothetical protein